MSISEEQARGAKQKVLDLIRNSPELSASSAGVGILPGWQGVKVNLARPLEVDSVLPPAIDGVPIYVAVVGETEKLD